ncbi:MAG: hypothetical protein QM762_07855 [Chryseolinea sp.]
MRKFRLVTQWLALIICVILVCLFGWEFYFRIGLDYNKEGRWFDEGSTLVYHEQTVEVFGFFLAFSVVLLILVVYWMRKSRRKQNLVERLVRILIITILGI